MDINCAEWNGGDAKVVVIKIQRKHRDFCTGREVEGGGGGRGGGGEKSAGLIDEGNAYLESPELSVPGGVEDNVAELHLGHVVVSSLFSTTGTLLHSCQKFSGTSRRPGSGPPGPGRPC